MSTPPQPADATRHVARRFLVSGRVQGVNFRHSTRLEAARLGIHGVARNLADGSVEIVAHGPQEALAVLRDWLSRGPPLARVSNVVDVDLLEQHRVSPGVFAVQ